MPGEVCIGGAGVALGYLNDDDGTKEKFVHDPFASPYSVSKCWTRRYRTGDRGVLRDDGALEILGRFEDDTQIKFRGLRMEMKDIENTILQSANDVIAKAVVISQGEPVVFMTYVLFSSNSANQTASNFLQQLASSLPLPQ
jgi:hybrid polyketide synthase/nonribosomal peptide synthetase ACE1